MEDEIGGSPTRGSMTWVDWHDGAWWICYSNYDGKGGDPTRDHPVTTLVKYSPEFVEQGAWLSPKNVLGASAI